MIRSRLRLDAPPRFQPSAAGAWAGAHARAARWLPMLFWPFTLMAAAPAAELRDESLRPAPGGSFYWQPAPPTLFDPARGLPAPGGAFPWTPAAVGPALFDRAASLPNPGGRFGVSVKSTSRNAK